MSTLWEDDNEDHREKGYLPKYKRGVFLIYAGMFLNKEYTVMQI